MFKAFKKRQVVLPILQTEESHRQLMDVHTGRHPCIRSGTIPFISLAAPWSVRSSGDFRRPPKVWRGKRQKPLKNLPKVRRDKNPYNLTMTKHTMQCNRASPWTISFWFKRITEYWTLSWQASGSDFVAFIVAIDNAKKCKFSENSCMRICFPDLMLWSKLTTICHCLKLLIPTIHLKLAPLSSTEDWRKKTKVILSQLNLSKRCYALLTLLKAVSQAEQYVVQFFCYIFSSPVM